MAKFDKQDQDIVATPEIHAQRPDDEDVEGHYARQRTPEETAQGNDRLANKPADDEDVEGHFILMRTPGDEQGKDFRV